MPLNPETVSFVDIGDILKALDITEERADEMMEIAFMGVTYGDAAITLVSSGYAFNCLKYANRRVEVGIMDDELEKTFWNAVGGTEYINLEPKG